MWQTSEHTIAGFISRDIRRLDICQETGISLISLTRLRLFGASFVRSPEKAFIVDFVFYFERDNQISGSFIFFVDARDNRYSLFT